MQRAFWLRADKYVTGGGPKAAEKARILLKLMQFIGAVSGGKTVTQVALNYLMCKGTAYPHCVMLMYCYAYCTPPCAIVCW